MVINCCVRADCRRRRKDLGTKRVDLSQNGNLIMVAVTLVLGRVILLSRWAVLRWEGSVQPPWRDFTQCVVKQKVG